MAHDTTNLSFALDYATPKNVRPVKTVRWQLQISTMCYPYSQTNVSAFSYNILSFVCCCAIAYGGARQQQQQHRYQKRERCYDCWANPVCTTSVIIHSAFARKTQSTASFFCRTRPTGERKKKMCYEIHTNHMHTVRLCTVHIVETRPVSCFSSVCRYSHLPPGRQHSRCLYFARPLSHRQHSDVVATPSPMLYFSFQEQIYRKEKNENRLRCNEKLAAFFGVCRAFIFFLLRVFFLFLYCLPGILFRMNFNMNDWCLRHDASKRFTVLTHFTKPGFRLQIIQFLIRVYIFFGRCTLLLFLARAPFCHVATSVYLMKSAEWWMRPSDELVIFFSILARHSGRWCLASA